MNIENAWENNIKIRVIGFDIVKYSDLELIIKNKNKKRSDWREKKINKCC